MSLLLLFKSGSSGGAVLGDGAATFDAMTGASAGGFGASGSGAATFDAMTGSATGTLPITGTSATTFGSMSGSAAGADDTIEATPDVVIVVGRDKNKLVTKDPSDARVYQFDWGTRVLGAEASIVTSTFRITALRPSGDTGLTKDNATIVDDDRSTQVRLVGGTLGATYRIDNEIVTDETPAQTIERSFKIKIAQQ